MSNYPIEADYASRWEFIKAIWKHDQTLFVILGIGIGLLVYPALQAVVSEADDVLQSLFPEAVGIGVTVLLIDRLNRRRDAKRDQENRKRQLFREARRNINDVSRNALHELKHEGWLDDFFATKNFVRVDWSGEQDLLRNVDLSEADLRNANLAHANLSETWFKGANLIRARFDGADLRLARFDGANLRSARFEGAELGQARFKGTNLWRARFDGADMWKAQFDGANLRLAQLEGANLGRARFEGARLWQANFASAVLVWKNPFTDGFVYTSFDESTSLPDRTMYDTAQGIEQMERFGAIVRWEDVPEDVKAEFRL